MNDWRPSSPPGVARRRALLLARVREFFAQQGVLEVDTPALGRSAVSDPNIASFSVNAASGPGYHLHTSPEYCMKRLLADGYPDIFSISRVFRDGEAGRRHLPEFTLIEWYRLGYKLADIINDTVALVRACLGDGSRAPELSIVDYAESVAEQTGIDVFTATSADVADRLDADAGIRAALGDDRDGWLDLLLDTCVTPTFPPGRLTVIRHFPASKAALARICPADARVADRFELFIGNMELANGYVELTDATEQRRRFMAEARKRGAPVNGTTIDERLLAALEHGLPECSGVALGLERLHMVLDGAEDIADVVTFARY